MSKIKIKQIHSDGQPEGAVLMTDGNGNNHWVVPEVGTGSSTYLGPAEDGSYTEGRYTGSKAPAVALEPTTKVSTAIDSLNEVLGLLLPTAPAPLSTGELSLSTANTTAKAAQGYTDNGITGGPAAGANVVRVTAANVDTTVLQDLGDGAAGTIQLWKNGAAEAAESFLFSEGTGDSKTTGLLRITDNKWNGTAVGGGQAPDGFFQSFDSQVVGSSAAVGLNTLQLRHSFSGNTGVLNFVRDSLTANPVVSAITVAQATKNAVFSSGIEHYTAGATLTVGANATNLAGETYATGTILSIAGPGTTVNFAAGQGGLPAILDKDTLTFDMTAQTFTVGGAINDRAQKITVTATNPNGSGNAQSATNLIVLTGTSGVREANIAGPGTTARVHMEATGDTPTNITTTAWSNTQDLTVAGFTHEAVIVGGQIRADKTDYSTGYLPVGINYSTKDDAQYITFSIKQGSKSSVAVTVTGTYQGVWVALPGVSTNQTKSPEALGDAWWDGMALYSGAGVPGRSGDTAAGCAAGTLPARTGTQTYTLTFGTESSSNSTANEILVRFRLNAGQAISAISFA
jgi:hypothetical protein